MAEKPSEIGDEVIASVVQSAVTALEALLPRLEGFDAALDIIAKSEAPLIICGVGKSGHIGRKIASTFRSLGKQSFFIHAVEASHGDLGCFPKDGAVLVLSNSGETSELSDLIYFCRDAHPLIAITGEKESTLAKASDVAIIYGPTREADPHGLAPTTSTTLMGVIGDALAIGYAAKTGFSSEQFAHFHPGGSLGARLKTVGDIMRKGDALPLLAHDAEMKDVMLVLGQKGMGIAVLMEGEAVYGIITDGDLRRHYETIWDESPSEIATRNPIYVARDDVVGDVTKLMSQAGITQALVMEGARLIGIVHMHDCLRI